MSFKMALKINWRYTIGEILIVIIGITIAFALNNFKDSHQNKKLRTQYLENLRSDIHEEIKQMHTINDTISQKLQDINAIKPYLGSEKEERYAVISKVFDIFRIVTFSPENTTYQTLINSGDMKLIDNFRLRKMIERHYNNEHQAVLLDYKRLENIYTTYLGAFLINQIDYQKLREGDFSFMDETVFASIITSIEGSYNLLIAANTRCLESNTALLKAINEELGILEESLENAPVSIKKLRFEIDINAPVRKLHTTPIDKEGIKT